MAKLCRQDVTDATRRAIVAKMHPGRDPALEQNTMRPSLSASVVALLASCSVSACATPLKIPSEVTHPRLVSEVRTQLMIPCGGMTLTVVLQGSVSNFEHVMEISWDGRQVSHDVLAAFEKMLLMLTSQRVRIAACYPEDGGSWDVVLEGRTKGASDPKTAHISFSQSWFELSGIN